MSVAKLLCPRSWRLRTEESPVHLTSFSAAVLTPDVILESGVERLGIAEEGAVQGDPQQCFLPHGSAARPHQAGPEMPAGG